MDITDINRMKQIGSEYGWSDAQLEMALGNAIRLCYAGKNMLVEADVNLEFGTIAARRRNGDGDRGVWIDIEYPLLPTTKEFIQVMELMQWGDGAPGRILEGDVSGYRDGGIIYRCLLYTSPSPRDQRGSRMPSSA